MAYDGTLKFDTKIDPSGMSKGLDKLKGIALAGAAAIGTGIGAAIKKGMDFEEAMSSVKAISGATQEEYEALSAAAKQMGETTKFSATESANALEYLSLAGYSAQESIEALPKVLNLAAAGGMDLAYASDLLTDSMAVMGLGIEGMDNFSDQLAMAASKSNTSVQQLGEAVLVCGGQAKNAGLGVDEMNTALGILADNGIKGSEGGTALRNVLKNLYTPTSQAAKEMESLGVKTADADGNLRDIQDVLRDLDGALSGLTEEEKMQAMSEIFDTRTISAANALLKDSGKRFTELQGYLTDCDGAAKKMADTMNDNLKGKLKLLGSAAEGLGIQLYESLQEPLKDAVDFAADQISKLTVAFRSGELSGAIKNVGTLFGDLVKTLTNLATAIIPPLVKVLGFLGEHIRIVAPLVVGLVSALTAYKVAVGIATAATALFNGTLALSPIGLVAAALGGLTAAVMTFSSKAEEESLAVREARREHEQKIDAILEERDRTIELAESVGHLNETYEESVSDIEAECDSYIELASELLALDDKTNKTAEDKKRMAAIVDILNGSVEGCALQFDEETGILSGNTGEIYNNIDAMRALARAEANKSFLTDAEKARAKATADYRAKLEELKTAMKEAADAEKAFKDGKGSGYVSAEKTVEVVKLKDELSALAEAGKRTEQDLVAANNAIAGSNVETWDESASAFNNWENAYDNWQYAMNHGVEELDSWINGFGSGSEVVHNFSFATEDASASATSSFAEMAESAKEVFGNDFPASTDEAKVALSDLYDKLNESGGYGEGFMEAFASALSSSDDAVFSSLDSFFFEVVRIMAGKQPTIEGQAQTLADGVSQILVDSGKVNASEAETNFESFGNAINKGLVNGMSQDNAVVSAAREVFKIPEEQARSILGIHSPSTVMMTVGGFVSAGLAVGIRNGKSRVIQAAIEVARAAINAAKKEADIRSPAHVMRDEVGIYLSEGMALGIMDGKSDVVSAVKRVANAALETGKQKVRFSRDDVGKAYVDGVAVGIIDNEYKVSDATKAMFDDLDLQRDLDTISEAEYYRQMEALRDQYIKQGTKEWWDYTKKIVDFEKDQMDDLKKSIVDTYSDIADAAIDAIDEVQKKQDKLAEKLASFGADALFQTETHTYKGMGRGTLWDDEAKAWYNEEDLVFTKTWLSDFKKENEQLEEYNEILSSICEKLPQMFGGTYDKGVEEALGQFLDMDIADAIEYGHLLLNATDEELAAHIAGLDGIMQKSKEVAEDTYAPEMENVVAEWKTELEKFYSEVPEEFKENGKLCAEKFGESFIEEFQNVISDALDVVSGISISIVPSLSGTTGEVIYNNATYNITAGGTSPHDIIEAGRQARERNRLLGY